MKHRAITPKQDRYIAAIVSGEAKTPAEAARIAGYGAHYAKRAAATVAKLPHVAAAIDAARVQLREKAQYDLQQAVQVTLSQDSVPLGYRN